MTRPYQPTAFAGFSVTGTMFKLLLIEAIAKTGSYADTHYPPLQLAYLAAYAAQQMDFEVEILTTTGTGIAEILAASKPQVVGIASVETNRRAVRLLRSHDINAVGSFIIGSPSETHREALDTIRLIEELELDAGEAYLAVPYPGTAFWDYAVKHGLVSLDRKWSRLRLGQHDGFDAPVVINDQMTEQQILGLLDKANAMLKKGRTGKEESAGKKKTIQSPLVLGETSLEEWTVAKKQRSA